MVSLSAHGEHRHFVVPNQKQLSGGHLVDIRWVGVGRVTL